MSLPDAQAWFTAARAWLDAAPAKPAETPENDALSALPAPVAGASFTAVEVVLRLDGRVVGEAWQRGPGTSAVRTALASALRQAQSDARIAALPEALRAGLGRRLSLELEFAGDPVPLVGERLDLMAARIEPALEGLAIRNGDRWVFALPSSVQAHNQANFLNYLSLTLAREVGLDPAASKDLKLPDGSAAYRLPTRRLAQRSFDATPFESVRGKPIVPLGAVDAAGVQAMALDLARHLRQRWPNTEALPADAAAAMRALGPRATYQPSRNEWPEPVSPPADQALAALAMAELSTAAWAPDDERQAARAFAIDTLGSVRAVADGESDPMADPAACGAILLAARTLDRAQSGWADEPTRAWLSRVADTLRHWPADRATPAPAVAAMAMAALGPEVAPALASAAWNATSAERVVVASPWLLGPGATPPSDASQAWRAALIPLVEAQFAARIDGASAEDLDGGWSPGASAPWPNAQSARAVAALATALQRDGTVEAAQRETAMRTLICGLRFLRQLQVDADACHAFRDPARAMGGIRAAGWDSDQPMAASAYALLASVRAIDAMATAGLRQP